MSKRHSRPVQIGRTKQGGAFRGQSGNSYRTMREQFWGEHMSGRHHGIQAESLKKFHVHSNMFWDYMENNCHLNSYHHIDEQHIQRFVDYLKDRYISQKATTITGRNATTVLGQIKAALADGIKSIKGIFGSRSDKQRLNSEKQVTIGSKVYLPLNDKSKADVMSSVRKIAKMIGKEGIVEPKNAAYGLHRQRKLNEEKPITFTADWLERRTAFQAKLEAVDKAADRQFLGPAGQLRLAYGLREKESIMSKSTLRVETDLVGAKHYLVSIAGAPWKEYTVTQLCSKHMYKASFAERLKYAEPGKEYLVVEGAKGGRRRLQEIYNDIRRTAIERVQELCRQTGHGSIIPKSMNLKQAQEYMTNVLVRSGGTMENLLHGNADRHWDTRVLKAAGFTKSQAIEERGHSDQRKLAYYDDDLSSWVS